MLMKGGVLIPGAGQTETRALEPYNCLSFEGGRFFKNRKLICKKLDLNDIKIKPANIEFLSVDSDFTSYPRFS
jgi:hypothetical protein